MTNCFAVMARPLWQTSLPRFPFDAPSDGVRRNPLHSNDTPDEDVRLRRFDLDHARPDATARRVHPCARRLTAPHRASPDQPPADHRVLHACGVDIGERARAGQAVLLDAARRHGWAGRPIGPHACLFGAGVGRYRGGERHAQSKHAAPHSSWLYFTVHCLSRRMLMTRSFLEAMNYSVQQNTPVDP